MRVTCTKLSFRRKPVPQPGYIPIFPNNRHAKAFGYAESFDCSSLSPMQLGPVGGALNLENYYQHSKVYEDELVPREAGESHFCLCGNEELGRHAKPGPAFFAARHKAYHDPVPHRHKRRNVKPVYSWYCDADGTTHCCTYVQSRWFYCDNYARLCAETEAYRRLKERFDKGEAKIEIFGYDAFTPASLDEDTLYAYYCDESRPFGHEMVLLCMLLDQAPWARYREEHRAKRVKIQ